MNKKRSLYYATILYEESAKENWQDTLQDLHIPCLISPLHDRDLDAQNNLKKPHWHILFLFESLKTREQFKEITEKIGGVGAELVMCPKSYALYLTHENAPNKVQYSAQDIISLSGADKYLDSIKIESINKYDVIEQIIRYCNAEDIDCLADIIEFSMDNNKDWFYTLASGYSSIMLSNYLKSRAWRNREYR